MFEALADVDDIEDIIGENDVQPKDRYRNKPVPIPKARKIKKKANRELPCPTPLILAETDNNNIDDQEDNNVEGNFQDSSTARVYVKTWGCAHNSSDSEYMAGQLAAQGYTITNNKEEANLWLLNSCTVKNPAEEHFKNEINKGLDNNKKVVVAGCVPQGNRGFSKLVMTLISSFYR